MKTVFEPLKNEQEFYDWLKSLNLPNKEFDYDLVYKMIYDNFYEIFGVVDCWEDDYINILSKNGSDLDVYIFNKLSDYDKESLRNSYDWDGNVEGIITSYIGDTSFAIDRNAGGPASPDFIKLFDLPYKRKVLDLFLCSIIYNLRNNIGLFDIDSYLGYRLK
jgi:hypothetical protein